VQIHWSWIAMLAAQLVLTGFFLTAIMVETHSARMQILKSSTLATLCGLSKACRMQLGGIHDVSTLKKRAESLDVKLERGSSGVALWLGVNSRKNDSWQPVPVWRTDGGEESG
jgi:hypothetical protein